MLLLYAEIQKGPYTTSLSFITRLSPKVFWVEQKPTKPVSNKNVSFLRIETGVLLISVFFPQDPYGIVMQIANSQWRPVELNLLDKPFTSSLL